MSILYSHTPSFLYIRQCYFSYLPAHNVFTKFNEKWTRKRLSENISELIYSRDRKKSYNTFRICLRKWWYTIFICLVRARSRGLLANSSAPELCSKALQYTVGTVLTGGKLFSFISFRRLMTGIISLRDWDRLIYSTSVVR